jgi:hypothetical protein
MKYQREEDRAGCQSDQVHLCGRGVGRSSDPGRPPFAWINTLTGHGGNTKCDGGVIQVTPPYPYMIKIERDVSVAFDSISYLIHHFRGGLLDFAQGLVEPAFLLQTFVICDYTRRFFYPSLNFFSFSAHVLSPPVE